MPEIDRSLFGAEHVRRYEETDGEVGFRWNNTEILILTTTGRKTGKTYKNALIFGLDSDNPMVVASYGGRPDHPDWYKNLVANPRVKVQILADRFDAVVVLRLSRRSSGCGR